MKSILYVLIASAFCIELTAQTWVQKNDFAGLSRRTASSVSANGKGYLTFGVTGSTNFKDVWEYNPVSDSWIQKADYPGPGRRGGIMVSNDTLIFAGLGTNGSSRYTDFRQYIPSTDTWISKAAYPGNGGFLSFAEILNGFVYVGGGVRVSSSNTYQSDFWKYDISNDTWSSIGNLPFGSRAAGSCIAAFGKLYLGMGHNNVNSSKDFWVYKPASNTWLQTDTFPGIDRLNPIIFKTANEEFIIGGGYQLRGPALNDYYKYNPFNDSWIQMPNNYTNSNRSVAATFTINDTAFVVGGWSGSQTTEYKDVWSFIPPLPTSTSEIQKDQEHKWTIFPNPANNSLTVNFTKEADSQYRIYSITGALLKDGFLNNSNSTLDCSELNEGAYFIQLIGNTGNISTKKFLIVR